MRPTARAGKGGLSVTVITPSERKLAATIERRITSKLIGYKVNAKEVVKIFKRVSLTRTKSEIEVDRNDLYGSKAVRKTIAHILHG